ncbi:ATP synthase subunit gamma, mitochondrial [Grifola frondosa]|uniref:ATP synthase subunit gamma, mitochondrial n=1 Tax=Grifola frondosa TaxID=5627 RepID=A0A1C7MMS6_GRIFR|nr:ATP synthase subunit gamma, mitochondrial [Grifola frondosa]
MLARRTLGRIASQPSVLGAAPSNARNMATLREIELRLKSVRNIEKITKSMKMIASTKLAKAQRAMLAGKEYGVANSEVSQHAPAENVGKHKLFIVISSDKGLCGGIHSSVSKATRRAFVDKESPVDEDSPIMVIGDKSKAQLSRALPHNLQLSFNQIGRDIPTFADAAGVADLVLRSGVKYDSIVIVYNKFVSAISYEPATVEIETADLLKESPGFRAYEMEDDVTKDLFEFSFANAIYAALVEGHACEQSARRNAMDNASKNASDMINRLQMQYNRGRQAAITNELVDIITGASALLPRWCGETSKSHLVSNYIAIMSFLVGPVSGVLVAGGVYYGFSTMIQTKTEQHRSDLHKLSRRLVDASANIPAPKPASERIAHRPFLSMLQSRWNTQLESCLPECYSLGSESHRMG